MKKTLCFCIAAFLLSCQSGSTVEVNEMEVDSSCEKLSANDFNSFLTITQNTPEKELKNILGKATGGSYTDDKAVFIYEFSNIKGAPIEVFVEAESGIIQTVFMEVLGLDDSFEMGIKQAIKAYPFDTCHASLLGKAAQDLITYFGEASKDDLKQNNVASEVRVLRYINQDSTTAVTFNFYPSQDYQLSSIVVDWY